MKKFGMAGLVAGAFSVAVIGFAGPAQADESPYALSGDGNVSAYSVDDDNYNPWLDKLYPVVKVPQVDMTVRH